MTADYGVDMATRVSRRKKIVEVWLKIDRLTF